MQASPKLFPSVPNHMDASYTGVDHRVKHVLRVAVSFKPIGD